MSHTTQGKHLSGCHTLGEKTSLHLTGIHIFLNILVDLGTNLPVPEDNNRYKTLFSCLYKIDKLYIYNDIRFIYITLFSGRFVFLIEKSEGCCLKKP